MTKEQLQWAMYEAYATQLLNRIEAQEAEIAKLGTMAEQTRADAVTRAAADEKRIEAMRQERDDMRAALAKEQELHAATALRMATEAAKMVEKKHPVKVGEWVRRTKRALPNAQIGDVVQVVAHHDDVTYRHKGGFWEHANCEPCDPPEATHDTPAGKDLAESVIRDGRKTEPKPGDTVRLVRIPSRDVVSPELRTVLEWPWIERWGTLNQTAMVVEPLYQLDGAVIVCLSTNAHVRWPINCLEVVTEATHDTEAGKAVAESAVSETVADEIKVGDVVKVVGASGDLTARSDIGKIGEVLQLDSMDGAVRLSGGAGWVNHRDVRKVTT